MNDFEKSVAELKEKIEDFESQRVSEEQEIELGTFRKALDDLQRRMEEDSSKVLDAWERTLLARHEQRPYTLDIVSHVFHEFTEICGDRKYKDDPAMICGFALFDGKPVVIVGH